MSSQKPELSDLSPELLCNIFQYLSLKEVLRFSMLARKMLFAVDLHLRLCKSIDFCESNVYIFMPSSITDESMHSLLKKCPQLEIVYGLTPLHVERRRLRKRSALTVPGIINALSLCPCLKAIETSNLKLLEAVMQNLPQLEIIGQVENRNAVFPPLSSERFKLQPYPKITTLNLIGVEVPELTAMPHLQHLYLKCVRFTKLQPFRAFIAHNLQTFVMKHCIGPSLSLRYLSLIIALSSSPFLRRLELVRVPLPSGLLQRAVEDSYRHSGFVNLTTLVISNCKGILETDIGHLMIVASQNMEHLYIQPSLTKDSLFVSLSFAQCSFPKLKTLHLGYVDELNTDGKMSNEALLNIGLAEVPDTPASLTDSGMKVIGQLFPGLETLSVTNCPHLILMDQWSQGETEWQKLLDLTLQRCHCLRLSSFSSFISTLPKIEVIILVDMFREPPKGCSHVGLSAGTGLGMSSAVVSNQDEHIAVQGHQQDFEPQADENVLENEDIDPFPPEPHLIVLERDLFDEQDFDLIEERVVLPEVDHFANPDIENNIENPVEDQGSGQNESEENVAVDKPDINSTPPSSPMTLKVLKPEEPADSLPSGESSDTKINQNGKRKKEDVMTNSQTSTKCKKICCVNHDSNKKECDSSETTDLSKSEQFQTSCVREFRILAEPICRCCDPSQPSTSTATCSHNCIPAQLLVDRVKTECISDSEMEPEIEPEIFITRIKDGSATVLVKQEKCSDEEKDCETACSKTDSEKILGRNKSYIGPITRHRSRMLDGEAEMVHDSFKNREKKIKRQKKRKTKLPVSGHCEGDMLTVHNLQPTLCLPRVSIKNININTASTQCENGNLNHNENAPSVINASKSHSPKNESSNAIEDKRENPTKHPRKRARQHSKSSTKKTETENQLDVSATANNQNVISVVSQGTQATSADIHHCLKKMKNQKKPTEKSSTNQRKKSVSNLKYSSISRRVKHKCKRSLSSNMKANKATSTSDPLLEEDAVQVLRLASETLRSLTIVSCGLSDIIINRSNQLFHVEVQACRILKSCQIYYCPALKKLNISQCPKLSFENVFPYILELETDGHLMVSFEPWNENYDPGDTESALFYAASLDQNIILCEDFTESSDEINQTFLKNRLFAWMDSLDSLVHLFGFDYKEPKIKLKPEEPLTFPWCHDLRRVIGLYDQVIPEHKNKQLKFELLTNNLLFASALGLFSWEEGFPKPEQSTLFANLGLLCEDLKKVARMQKRIKAFYIPVDKYPEEHLEDT